MSLEEELTLLKNKISVLRKDNRELKDNFEKSESEKIFQKELYEDRLDIGAEKNFKLRQYFITHDKQKELEKIEEEKKAKK